MRISTGSGSRWSRASFRVCLALCLGLAVIGANACGAETLRALIVGVNTYQSKTAVHQPQRGSTQPPESRNWTDLDGAVNDAVAFREVLVSRFGFKPVRLLTNTEATRDAILQAFQEQLIAPAKPGDVCVFFYSGHGSQMKNSRCVEPDCMDETIVPVDGSTGAVDIRDKEWERLFNDVLDRGALLTVFFDSCHSGSISRGLPRPGKSRFLKPLSRDAATLPGAEKDDPRPSPESRGALVFSASQDFQSADETKDGQGVPHGIFSLALLSVLRTMPPGESAENVFRRVRARVHADGITMQNPELPGPSEQHARELFGPGAAQQSGRTTVAVSSVGREGVCELQGGLALGLCAGCELRKLEPSMPPEKQNQDPTERTPGTIRLRVESVDGLSRCKAKVVEGSAANVAAGDLFVVDRWMGCDQPFLRIWMPPANLPLAELQKMARAISPLRAAPELHWVDDPVEETPTHTMSWDGSTWRLASPDGSAEDVSRTPSAAALRERLRAEGGVIRLFVHFPPPTELVAHLRFAPKTPESPVQSTTVSGDAHYLLAGRVHEESIEYAWILPNTTRTDAERGCPLPERTDWCALPAAPTALETVADRLDTLARRTGQLRMWLQLEPPPESGVFPYRLVLRGPKGPLEEGSTVYDGDALHVLLRGDEKELRQGMGQRYVYVFNVDRSGKTQLLLPQRKEGNSGNRVAGALSGDSLRTEIRAGEGTVSQPFGIDTYILLWTKEPLPNPDVLEGAPLRTTRGEPESPLARLLHDIATGTRGMTPRNPTPADWSIQRFTLRSAPRPGSRPGGDDP